MNIYIYIYTHIYIFVYVNTYIYTYTGTEPAGDIVYALYDKVNFDDGTFEYVFKGAHAGKSVTCTRYM
jgi:hypothetical protein